MKQHKTVFKKWLLSYLAILLIPFTVSIITYSYTYNYTTKQSIRVYESLASQIQSDIDNKINDVYGIFSRLNLSVPINRVISPINRYKLNPFDYYEANTELIKQAAPYTFVDDILIYIHPTDKIISTRGNWNSEEFFNTYFGASPITFDEFKENLFSSEKESVMELQSKKGEELLVFPYRLNRRLDKSAVACVVINKEHFMKQLETARWDDSVSIYISGNNSPILAASPLTIEELATLPINYSLSYQSASLNGEKTAIISQKSRTLDWYYVLATPDKLFKQGVINVQRFTFIGLLISSILGVLFAYNSSRRQYQPLKEVLDTFSSSDNEITSMNEYAWLKQTAASFRDKLVEAEEQIDDYSQKMKDHFLFRLLETPFDINQYPLEMKRLGISFSNPYNIVILFSFDDNQSLLFSSNTNQGRATLSFTIKNLFSELLGNYYRVELVDSGKEIAVIVNIVENSIETILTLEESISVGLDVIQEGLHARVFSTMGGIHEGLPGIYISCLEAKEAMQHTELLDSDAVLNYSEIKNLRQGYEYPVETEQKIINAIRLGDSDLAVSLFETVLVQNEKYVVGDMRKCFIFDLLGTVIKGINQAGLPEMLNHIDVSKLLRLESNQELVLLLRNTSNEIAKRLNSTNNKNNISNSIEKFISDNFKNPNLNVSMVGEHYDMTPAYLSSLYQEEKNRSILDFINLTRVEHAKKLLSERHSVTEAAEQSGFRASNTFIRTFKRYEGITPGQYKNLTIK